MRAALLLGALLALLGGVAHLDASSIASSEGTCNEARARSGDDTVVLACKATIASNPKDDLAYANLCAALSDDMLDPEQLKSALGYCDEAIRLNPKSVLAHKNRADVLARLGRHSESLAEVNLAVDLARKECARVR